MLAESILQRDGTTLGNFMIQCDEYSCKMTPISVAQRDSKGGVLTIIGIAATPDPVDRIGGITETFPADVLKRDGHTLEGKAIVDWHSEWPRRVRLKDIIGQVIKTWWDKTRGALMFEGVIWNANAMEVLQRKVMINFSPGYGAIFDTDSDGNKAARQIEFDHLGYLSRPADKKAELVKLAKEATMSMRTEILSLDMEDFSRAGDNELMAAKFFLQLGYNYAREHDDKWGDTTLDDISNINTNLLTEMAKREIQWSTNERGALQDMEDIFMSDKDDKDKRANGEGPFTAGPGGTCICPECGHKEEHERNIDCKSMKCPHCGTVLERLLTTDDKAKDDRQALPKADIILPWDGPAAEKRMKARASSDGSGDKDKMDWKKYGHGFAYVEPNPDGFGMFHLPFADVIDGKLKAVWRGVAAAGAAVQGARGAELSTEAKNSAKRTLGPYYTAFEKKAPWAADRSDDNNIDDNAKAQPSKASDGNDLDSTKRGDTMPDEDKDKKPDDDAGKGPDDKKDVKDQKPEGDKAPEGADSTKREEDKAAPKKDDAKPDPADDGKKEPKKDEKPDDKAPEGQRAGKDIPSGTATENLDALIKTLRADDKNKETVAILEKAKESLEPKKEPEKPDTQAREEESPMVKELREEVDKLKAESEQAKREAHKVSVESRVDKLIDEKKYTPGQREELIKLVDGMTDEQYNIREKLDEGREAYSTDDMGKMTKDERAKQATTEKEREQKTYDAYVEEQRKANPDYEGLR